jgi:PIN domain nuclease of toxin-antitoxin system
VKLLLDTHSFLWFIGGSEKLSTHARALIEDEDNACYLSVASLWEMAIKVSMGKLNVPLPFTRLVRRHVTGNNVGVLPIEPEHLDEQREMPFHHRDPFDRLIIAQAIAKKDIAVYESPSEEAVCPLNARRINKLEPIPELFVGR